MSTLSEHMSALQASYDDAVSHIASAADDARANVEGSAQTLRHLAGPEERPPIIANVPIDDVPAYVPPAPSMASNALIPDTPLVSSTLNPNSLAFDDAPLWQS
jgi:hypothetical protein